MARDALLAAGFATAALRGDAVRPWLAACVVADGADIAATLADRTSLPPRSAAGTALLAGTAALCGAALYAAADR